MFRSLRLFNYRVWFVSALVSNVGFWMQAIAQNWVVLTELTRHDALSMGVTTALQTLPPLLLVTVTGWLADRFDRRVLLCITQSALGLFALAAGLLLLAGWMSLGLMWCFALAIGVATAIDTPARNAFVSDLVPVQDAANAVALNSASYNVARMIGPAVGGLLVVAIGSGWVFVANAVSFVATLIGLAIMRPGELRPRAKGYRSRLADGFRYVVVRRDYLTLFTMTFMMSAFALNFPIVASTMTIMFGGDADSFGALTAAFAVGALTGALTAARRRKVTIRIAATMTLIFTSGAILSCLAPGFWTFGATCAVMGFGTVSFFNTANGYVQTNTDPSLRGRVLAIYVAIFIGSTPFGAPLLGAVADLGGPRASSIVLAGAGLVAFAVATIFLARNDNGGAVDPSHHDQEASDGSLREAAR